jgi:putative ABC transport system permease protein
LIGVIIGEAIIYSNILGSNLPMIRSRSGDATAVFFAVVTGLFFGWYPARRASKLDPVDALRS